MTKLYKNKYKVHSARYQNYDYSAEGFYFVTWCVKDMKCVLSRVTDDEVVLSPIGEIVESQVKGIGKRYHNVLVDSYVIMPNHVHIIIHIGPVETGLTPSLHKVRSLPNIIGQIKSHSTGLVNKKHNTAGNVLWQPRFYDHIIRNDKDLQSHREYIGINPVKWPQDKYYQK